MTLERQLALHKVEEGKIVVIHNGDQLEFIKYDGKLLQKAECIWDIPTFSELISLITTARKSCGGNGENVLRLFNGYNNSDRIIPSGLHDIKWGTATSLAIIPEQDIHINERNTLRKMDYSQIIMPSNDLRGRISTRTFLRWGLVQKLCDSDETLEKLADLVDSYLVAPLVSGPESYCFSVWLSHLGSEKRNVSAQVTLGVGYNYPHFPYAESRCGDSALYTKIGSLELSFNSAISNGPYVILKKSKF
ncbi:MAG: hypothetical protein WCV90_08340 [Candidatus Woesearchaeota archaeon]